MAKAPTRNDIISKYLNGDLDRFLKRYFRFSRREDVYSVLINELAEDIPNIWEIIQRKYRKELPGAIMRFITVHRVMVKHYGFYNDEEDLKISKRIEDVLYDEINIFCQKRYRSGQYRVHYLSRPKVIKELKARGYIRPGDFIDYDPSMGHITTNKQLDVNLIFPMNFRFGVNNKGLKDWWEIPEVYNVHGLVGISGFTRVSTPLQR